MDVATKPFLNLKFSREDVGLPTSTLPPPTLTNPLRGVEQNTMQHPISVNVWDTETSPLHRQHFEINEERDRGQEEWTASTNRFGDAADGLTVGNFDCQRPSVDPTLSGASNVMATPTNAAAKFGQKQHVGNIPALSLTTASPIAPRHEVEPSGDELKARSWLQVLHPSTARQRRPLLLLRPPLLELPWKMVTAHRC